MVWPKGVSNPTNRRTTDEQFIEIWRRNLGNARKVSTEIGLRQSNVLRRRRRIEERTGIVLGTTKSAEVLVSEHSAFFKMKVEDGVVLVATDPHYWPGEMTTCQRGFLYFVRNFEPRPKAIVINGDVFDGSRISRHPKVGFLERAPSVADEIKVCQERLTEIEEAAPKGIPLVWPLGNHDLRYESYLASAAPEVRGVHGMHLKDHFQRWNPCWTFWVNEGAPGWLEVKHRFRGGIHAPYNNTLKAGISIVTGHLHSMMVYPWTDRRGTRFGVDAGTLADVDGDEIGSQFVNYLEANPVSWRSGFVVLTFKDGRLMWPELAAKWDEHHIEFRGNLIRV